jgi:hypothetical protein
MYSLFYKERINNQANFYLKQNPQEANMTIAQMKALIGTGNKNHVVKNIQRYMSNIPGTPSYWYALNLDLETIIKDKGPPHAFFTFSYPNLHDAYLHEVLGLKKTDRTFDEINKKLKSMPHITNEFFVHKFVEFKKIWLEERYLATPKNKGWVNNLHF